MAKDNKAPVEEQNVEVPTEADVANDTQGEEAQASLEPVQLQINDLQGLGQIINLACKRGAFEAGEMQTIGTAFNKLNAFLGYVAAQQSMAKADEAEGDNPASTEE